MYDLQSIAITAKIYLFSKVADMTSVHVYVKKLSFHRTEERHGCVVAIDVCLESVIIYK